MKTMKLYSYLLVEIIDDLNLNYSEVLEKELVAYESIIREAMKKALPLDKDNRGIMNWFYGTKSINNKIYSAVPEVEVMNNNLYGVLICKINEELCFTEFDEFTNFWNWQLYNGWGKAFGTNGVETMEGVLYIYFFPQDLKK